MSKAFEKAQGIIRNTLTFGINPSLEPMKKICGLLGNPQLNYSCIQIGGTNGKTSTSRYLAALLRASGYKTGLYTSPELTIITERIEIDGCIPEDEVFAQAIIRVHDVAEEAGVELTEFELITAAALCLFAEQNVEYAVLEVGLGGRWDATSVVHPILAVLTGVDLDHTAVLGDTIAEIATEKAPLIKQGTIVVAAPTNAQALDIFRARADEQQARFVQVPAASEPESNSYQAQNKLTALTALRELFAVSSTQSPPSPARFARLNPRDSSSTSASWDEAAGPTSVSPLPLSDEEAYRVMGNTIIPGRLEALHHNPLLIIDAAHNPAAAQMLVGALALPHAILLLAVLADKDARTMIRILAPHFAEIVVTQTASPRAIPASQLAELVQETTGKKVRLFATPKDALAVLLEQEYPIVATGSITLAGEVKRMLSHSLF